MVKLLPNALTAFRLALVPFISYQILTRQFNTAFIWLFFAALSDGLDGFLARRMKARTILGAYLDPLADKVLVAAIYISLTAISLLPTWFTIIVIARDVAIVLGLIWLRVKKIRVTISPSFLSKVNTTFQLLLVLLVLVNEVISFSLSPFILISIGVILATTIISGVHYFLWGVRYVQS